MSLRAFFSSGLWNLPRWKSTDFSTKVLLVHACPKGRLVVSKIGIFPRIDFSIVVDHLRLATTHCYCFFFHLRTWTISHFREQYLRKPSLCFFRSLLISHREVTKLNTISTQAWCNLTTRRVLVLANSRFVTWPLDGKHAEITSGESSSFLEIARQLCLYFFFENLGNFLEYNVFKLRNTESWVLSNKSTLTPRRHARFKIIQWLRGVCSRLYREFWFTIDFIIIAHW